VDPPVTFHIPRVVKLLLAGIALVAMPACKHRTPPAPEPPLPLDPPTVACPATVVADVQEAPASVQYPSPVVTGGAAPVTISCTIDSGAKFPIGISDILCTATDSLSRRAQCTFQIQVNVIAKLKGTKFLAFGDSITKGAVSDPVPVGVLRAVDSLNAYPTQLQSMLVERYPSQIGQLQVLNKGEQGFLATQDEDRFIAEVRSNRPDAVLLLEGVNDIHHNEKASDIAASLDDDARRALNEGTKIVFVSTLLPQVPGRPSAHAQPGTIEEVNDLIRALAARPGVVVVDSYAVFNPRKQTLIGQDGLHPTIEGYRVLAETFLAAIKANFEAPPAPARR
jgi:lysophospholipase L1-like esterase